MHQCAPKRSPGREPGRERIVSVKRRRKNTLARRQRSTAPVGETPRATARYVLRQGKYVWKIAKEEDLVFIRTFDLNGNEASFPAPVSLSLRHDREPQDQLTQLKILKSITKHSDN